MLPLLLVLLASIAAAQARIEFTTLPRDVVQARVLRAPDGNERRSGELKKLFGEAGCEPERLREQPVQHVRWPNVICTLPGESELNIVVGAHFDMAEQGKGVIDNWSGASLLPSFFESLNKRQFRHTYHFIGFTSEERGLIGSDFYLGKLSKDERGKTRAMVNVDSVGLTPTKVWLNGSDKKLAVLLLRVAQAMKLPLAAVNVEQVGSDDAQSFRRRRIPTVSIHSVTQETFPILHSVRDNFSALKFEDYYDTYRLVTGYLVLLDQVLDAEAKDEPGAK